MRRILALLALAIPFALFPSLQALASGPVAGAALSDEAFSVTQRVNGQLVEVGPAPTYALRLRLEDDRELTVTLEESVKLRAADKKAFDGRKKLSPEDLSAGQRVQLTFRAEPFKVLELKVLKAEPGA